MSTPTGQRRRWRFRAVASVGRRMALWGLGLCAALAFYVLHFMPFAFAETLVIPWWMFVPPVVLLTGSTTFVIGRVGSWLTEYS